MYNRKPSSLPSVPPRAAQGAASAAARTMAFLNGSMVQARLVIANIMLLVSSLLGNPMPVTLCLCVSVDCDVIVSPADALPLSLPLTAM